MSMKWRLDRQAWLSEDRREGLCDRTAGEPHSLVGAFGRWVGVKESTGGSGAG